VGKQFLAKQLLSINSSTEQSIENRQKVVQELAQKLDWRQDFMATALATPMRKDDNNKINDWINQPIYFLKKLHFKLLVVILPIITLTFLGLFISGISHYSWFILFALMQLMIASLILRRTNKEQSKVSEELRILKNYAKLLNRIESEDFASDHLIKLKNDLFSEQASAMVALKKLIRIIDAFDTRLNLILGVVLNATLMWDLYSVMRLEKWKLTFGDNIKQWTQVVAEIDYYISLANYVYNNPDFVYPTFSGQVILDAKELGHPLIPQDVRVNNDFEISGTGKIEIITGANMAGKSTFLRTVGVNLILAANGLSVCATKFDFKLQKLYSGMRTADSLKENESYFYAELKRLKYIIEKLREGQQVFILLDEILKGTNSVDKAKGSWKFVENLIALQATGIVATHDLSLCDLEEKYTENIENKCFEVQIDGDKIAFDYKLRSGITRNMNASLLMKQMGIFAH
jgi:DNA mismatch repair ATPase MutS